MTLWLTIAATSSASTCHVPSSCARRVSPNRKPGRAAQAGAALGDPTRLMVAAALRDGGELCVCDLAWVAERSQNLVSHHVRRLRAAGLVRSRRDGKMVMYSLTETGERLLEVLLEPARGEVRA